MKGSNTLNFCTSQMIEAIEFYLKQKYFQQKQEFTVESIDEKTDGYCKTYSIRLKSAEDEDKHKQ